MQTYRHIALLTTLLTYSASSLAGVGLMASIYLGTEALDAFQELGPQKLFLPSVVFIEQAKYGPDVSSANCSGVLVKDKGSLEEGFGDLVLTASHCIDTRFLDEVTVESSPAWGIEASSSGVKQAWVDSLATNSVIQGNRDKHIFDIIPRDLALLRLKQPIKGNPLELKVMNSESLLRNGRKAFVAGYGTAPQLQDQNDRRGLFWHEITSEYALGKAGQVRAATWSDKINEENLRSAYWLDDTIVAMALNSKGKALAKECPGDSGGPLIVVEDNQAYIAGISNSIVSVLKIPGPCGEVTIFTKIKASTKQIKTADGMRRLP